MDIDTREVRDAVIELEKVADKMPHSDFLEGALWAYKLVRTYLMMVEEKEGKEMAEALDGNKS